MRSATWRESATSACGRELVSRSHARRFAHVRRTYHESGRPYYGQDSGASAPKYGSQGTATQNRYSGSTYAQGGGFRDSKYANKPGSYRDSKYASPGARDPNADHSPKRFGSGSREAPHAAPAARPMPSRPPMRSPGRSFGRRH